MRRTAATTLATAAAATVMVVGACSHPAPSRPAVDVVVPGGPAAWQAVSVGTGTRSVDLPADLRRPITPLRASRALDRPAPLNDYGLDRPQAQLVYRAADSGATTTVDLGAANFDRHFVYAQRRGSATVYLLPADTLRPVLALVAIDVAPPD
ncbi:MAG: hypothetical protein JWP02_1346 [Acidimicrobiales bacterium]|nr:hypothetical protein [Acidimicrobiales bacterium]